MWLRRSLFVAVVFFVGLSTLTLAQDKKDDKKDDKNKAKTTLAWKLEKNKPFYQKMTTKTDQTMKVQSQEVKQTQTQTFYFSFTPTEEKDGAWTIKQKIEGVQMDIDIGGTKISYDSTKPETATNPLGEFFKALVGSEFTLTVAPKDKDNKELTVTKIEGRDEFRQEATGKANPQMQPLLNQILSEAALKEMATPTFAALPGKEVTQGDSWKRAVTLDMGPIGKYETNYTYTYDGPDPKDAKLQVIKVETIAVEVQGAARGGRRWRSTVPHQEGQPQERYVQGHDHLRSRPRPHRALRNVAQARRRSGNRHRRPDHQGRSQSGAKDHRRERGRESAAQAEITE